MQAPGSKAVGKCTCKGNASQRPTMPTKEETSPGVTDPVEKCDRMTIGWAASPTGSPRSKNVDPLAGRPEEVFYEGGGWVVFVKLEG